MKLFLVLFAIVIVAITSPLPVWSKLEAMFRSHAAPSAQIVIAKAPSGAITDRWTR